MDKYQMQAGGKEVENKGAGSKIMLTILSIFWLLFLIGILGYTPYSKKVPKQLEDKVEHVEEIYKDKNTNGVNQKGQNHTDK